MKTPEQGFIAIIKELREKGLRYRQLMRERDRAENCEDDEDDDTVSRSTQSIDHEIDNLLNDTMTTARKLVCDKDTDGDGDCHECHKNGGCPLLKSPASEQSAGTFTVIGFYDDSGLRFVCHRQAVSPAAAIGLVAETYPDDNISVCAVIAGEHKDLMEGDYLEDTEDIIKGEGN